MEKTPQDIEFDNWIREYYNKKVTTKANNEYEKFRWFSTNNKRRQYRFTIQSLHFHFKDVELKNCLDIGCGPGTWTKLLMKKYPKAKFVCVDISKEMINQFKKSIDRKEKKRLKFIVSSFIDANPKGRYDFVFASRSIEYMPNKPLAMRKINKMMKPGGQGIIVTSPPHKAYLKIKKFLGKKVNKQHTKRISVEDMRNLLRKEGFKNIKFYPILFTDSPLVPTSFLFHNFYRKRWCLISKMFASGYLVKFKKPSQ